MLALLLSACGSNDSAAEAGIEDAGDGSNARPADPPGTWWWVSSEPDATHEVRFTVAWLGETALTDSFYFRLLGSDDLPLGTFAMSRQGRFLDEDGRSRWVSLAYDGPEAGSQKFLLSKGGAGMPADPEPVEILVPMWEDTELEPEPGLLVRIDCKRR